MRIKVVRTPNETGTPGKIYVDGVYVCRSTEDRTPKNDSQRVKGICCVPLGVYNVKPRFEGSVFGWMSKKVPEVAKYGIPHIMNIPGVVYPKWIDNNGILPNQWVLMHIGNTEEDTLGCLLPGMVQDSLNTVARSTEAFTKLYDIIKIPMSKGEVTIEYVNE